MLHLPGPRLLFQVSFSHLLFVPAVTFLFLDQRFFMLALSRLVEFITFKAKEVNILLETDPFTLRFLTTGTLYHPLSAIHHLCHPSKHISKHNYRFQKHVYNI